MAKCAVCGQETGDHIKMCRECADEIILKCYCCSKPAVHYVQGYWLCEECYQIHVVNNARAIASMKKQLQVGIA